MKKLLLVSIIITLTLNTSEVEACTIKNQGINQIYYDFKDLNLSVTGTEPEPEVYPVSSGMPRPINTCPKRQIDQSYLNFIFILRGVGIALPTILFIRVLYILKKRKR